MLDIYMPIKDGFEVLNFIMENDKFKKIPVIMMSTDRETKNIAACLKKGAKNYIVKPIKPLFLKKTLEDNIKQEISSDNIDPDLIQY